MDASETQSDGEEIAASLDAPDGSRQDRGTIDAAGIADGGPQNPDSSNHLVHIALVSFDTLGQPALTRVYSLAKRPPCTRHV